MHRNSERDILEKITPDKRISKMKVLRRNIRKKSEEEEQGMK